MNSEFSPETQASKRIPFTFTQWIVNSVDGRFYPSLRGVSSRLTIAYLSRLIILAILITSLAMAFYSYHVLDVAAQVFEKHFSPMEFKDGQLRVLGKEPIVYSGETFQVIVDTEGEHPGLDPFFDTGMILRKDRLIVTYPGMGKGKEFTYRQLGLIDFSVDAATIRDSKKVAAVMMLTIFAGGRLFLWILFKGVQVFMGFLFVSLISDSRRVTITQDERLNIAATALVPPIFLHILQIVFQLYFPSFFTLYIFVYVLFLIVGTRGLTKKMPADQSSSSANSL